MDATGEPVVLTVRRDDVAAGDDNRPWDGVTLPGDATLADLCAWVGPKLRSIYRGPSTWVVCLGDPMQLAEGEGTQPGALLVFDWPEARYLIAPETSLAGVNGAECAYLAQRDPETIYAQLAARGDARGSWRAQLEY
jgi:hypothetical protein